MRKVYYFQFNQNIYPVVLTTNEAQYRLDVLRNGEVDVNALGAGKSYKGINVLYSVIYGKTGRVRYKFGNDYVLNKLFEYMSSKERTDFLIKMHVQRIDFTGEDRFVEVNTIAKTTSVNKLTSLVYTEVQGISIADVGTYTYSSVKMKDLQYFIETKDLKLETKDYKCIDTYDKLHEYIDGVDWSRVKYTAKDTETTGLKFHWNAKNPDKIVGMSHSYKDKQGVYIVFRHDGRLYLDPQEVFKIMQPVMQTKQVWQNGPFDDRVLRTYDIQDRIDYELTDLFQLTNPSKTAPKALKYNARELLDEDTIELDEILGKDFDANLTEFIPLDLMTVYACADTDYTLRIFKILYSRLDTANKILTTKNAENIRIISAADWFGFPSDKEYLEKLIAETEKDKKRMEDFILSYICKEYSIRLAKDMLKAHGAKAEQITEDNIQLMLQNEEFKETVDKFFVGTRKPYFELDYAEDKLKLLYTILQYPKLRMTDSGKSLSTGKDYFTDLLRYVEPAYVERMTESLYSANSSTGEEDDILIDKDKVNTLVFPVAHMMLQYAIVDTKYKNYLRILNSYEDGRSYITYNTAVTTTGRITCGIQTLPGYAKQIIGNKQDAVRGLIVFDFDQIELRAAHNEAIAMWRNMRELPQVKAQPNSIINTYDYSDLVNIFNDFESDVHTEMASRFTKLPVDQVSSKVRKSYKETTFAGLYGGSAVTMGRKELAKAKTQEDRVRIIKEYEQNKATWLSTDLHLLNYFEISKQMPLIEIPVDKIPFNLKSDKVGMSIARSGRKRFFNLKNIEGWERHSISNQGRNQPIQGGCFDIYFEAIRGLTNALREQGVTEDEVRSLIFVHDEDGLEYLKTNINPLWLCAMIFKYCCIQIDDLPIKYYCTPAVVCNWAQGKSDKYEIPKGMLAKLSLNRDDYEILDTMKHDEYVLQKINEYYCDEMEQEMRKRLVNNCVELNQIDFTSRFKFFKNSYMYMKGKTKVSQDKRYNMVLNILSQVSDRIDFNVSIDGKIIPQGMWSVEVTEEEKHQMDKEIFDEFDLDNYMDDAEKVDSILSTSGIIESIVNLKTLDELNKTNINLDNIVQEYIPKNIICEEFADRIMFLFNRNEDGELKRKQFDRIDELITSMNSPVGRRVIYCIEKEAIETNMHLPYSFKVQKFDNLITSLRIKTNT